MGNHYFWHSWWGDFWISWGDFIFRVVPCSGVTSCQKGCERSSTRTADDGAKPGGRWSRVPGGAAAKATPKEKIGKEKKAPPKEGKQKRRRNQRRRLRLASELLFKQSLRKSESACWAAVDILEVPSGSEKVGDSGKEEDSLSYAPTDPLDTGTKIKDRGRAKKT